MFPRRGAQTLGKRLHWLGDKLHAWRSLFRGLPREDVVGELRVEYPAFAALLFVICESPIIGLATPQDCVDGPVERGHSVIDRARMPIEPFNVAVRAGDVAVGACCN